MKKIAVVILNWNGRKYLEKFLGDVLSKSVSSECDVFVADNCSEDDSVDYIRAEHPQVKIIVLESNMGFAGGYKEALRHVKARYYVLLNSDVEVSDGWLQPVIKYLDANPGTAACQPKILDYNNRDHFEYAGAAGGYIDKYGYPFCRGRVFNNIEKDNGQYNDTVNIFWASGACIFIRSSVWEECGGLDPDFFAHMEEIDLCWRILSSGYKISYIPDSVVYHVGGGTLSYDSPAKLYYNFRNNLFLLHKNLPGTQFKKIIARRKLLDGIAAVRFLLLLRLRSVASIWKAHRDYSKQREILDIKRESILKEPVDPKDLILNKSVVFAFYINREITYRQLMQGK